MQDQITPLSELRPIAYLYNIHVRVSRTWEFRGKSEHNDLVHFDMVLIDQKGYAMYCEVPKDILDRFKEHLQEGKILYICKPIVEKAKPTWRVVDAPYMLKFSKRTQIIEAKSDDTSFPKYAFSLTPIELLPQFARRTDRFLDVLGKITAVSNAAVVRDTSGDLMMRRIIQLQDDKGTTVELSLAGKRAIEFDAESVFEVGQKNHVIAIFVGTSMKVYGKDYKFLGGSSACRWYINENDMPAIRAFQRRLPHAVTPIQKINLQSEDYMDQGVEEKTLFDLKKIDPYTEKNKKFQCTVTLTSLADKQQWCYRACRVCNSRMVIADDGYKCTKATGCSCTQFDWKYKICFIGADDTYSLEFMFFEKKGVELIGKSAENLRKQYDPTSAPPDIAQWINHKFTFIVKVLYKRSTRNTDPSFEVVIIKERHGKQATLPSILCTGSITSSIDTSDLPPLVPIAPIKMTEQASSSTTPQFTDIRAMDIDNQSDAWDSNNYEQEASKDEQDTDEMQGSKRQRTT